MYSKAYFMVQMHEETGSICKKILLFFLVQYDIKMWPMNTTFENVLHIFPHSFLRLNTLD